MARERKTSMQKEGVHLDDTLPFVQTSPLSGLASPSDIPDHRESLHRFLRALARELARTDHERNG